MFDTLDGPDVVAVLPGVRSPTQEGRSGEEETPEPAGHHQTPGQSSTVELSLTMSAMWFIFLLSRSQFRTERTNLHQVLGSIMGGITKE